MHVIMYLLLTTYIGPSVTNLKESKCKIHSDRIKIWHSLIPTMIDPTVLGDIKEGWDRKFWYFLKDLSDLSKLFSQVLRKLQVCVT